MNIRHGRERPGYVLVPSDSYLEFLPVDDQGVAEEKVLPLQPQEVEVSPSVGEGAGDFWK